MAKSKLGSLQSLGKIARLLLRFAQTFPLLFSILVGVTLAAGFLEGVGISAMVPLLNLFFDQGGSGGTLQAILSSILLQLFGKIQLSSILFFILIVFAAQSGMVFIQNALMARLQVDFHRDCIRRLYGAYLKASWPFFYRNKIGELSNTLIVETERAATLIQFASALLAAIAMAIFYGAIMFFVSIKLSVICIFSFGLVFVLLQRISNLSYRYGEGITESNAEIQKESGEKLQSIRLIKSTVSEALAFTQFLKKVDVRMRLRFLSLVNGYLVSAIMMPVMVGVLCGCIYYAISYMQMAPSVFILFIFCFFRLLPKVQMIQNYTELILSFLPSINEIDKFVTESESAEEKSGTVEFNGIQNEIRFESVSFRYDQATILNEISLTIKKNSSVGIVGTSGGGKSTIADLLMGFLTPTSGKIMCDTTDLATLDLYSWRQQIGYVSQEVQLLNDTVYNNLTWGNPNCTAAEVERVAELCHAHSFIMNLPNKYQTSVGDRGSSLSGGQRQRIALARTLLRKPALLILDEATSALDAESAAFIQETLNALGGSLTILVITHRLSSLNSVDTIYVIEKGKVHESGSWNELSTNDSRFRMLLTMSDPERPTES